ncbi:uncharacterized protein LOC141587512 [Silene latifolia]|uniref:uncharacterized protein LOC141587512 n=1 Tax=Silene latifolia TaxID=37657 RepID=UPI003D771BE5
MMDIDFKTIGMPNNIIGTTINNIVTVMVKENYEDPGEENVDYGDNFVFSHPFNTFEEAFDRCDEVAYGLGFHLVKAKYHMEKSPPYKIVKCDRHGPYNSKAKDPLKPQRKSKTKKFMCPFSLRMIKKGEGVWVVVPKCGVHNHKFGKFLEGHRRRAKFTEEQKELIKQYRQSHVKPGMVRHAFTLGYALIENEGKEGYNWVLRRLESLLEPGVRPTVIVTDHERGLLAALPGVFRTSHHFLCLFHVYTAIEARATNMERNGNFGKALAHGAWKKVVEAKTFDECTMEWNELRKKYCCHPALISYLELTWWHKIHMFGKCFTNLVLHFGNTTTSRVESAHAQLKMWLGSAELTLDSIWKRADVMLHGQHIEIRKTLEDSISKTVVTNMYYGNIFSMLSGRVSATAIEAMLVEYNRGTDLGYYLEENCGCTLWTTHKLLCACRLHTVFHEGKRIHPDDLHVFWSRLAYTDSGHRRFAIMM